MEGWVGIDKRYAPLVEMKVCMLAKRVITR